MPETPENASRAAALQREAERAGRLRRAAGGGDLRQPAFDERRSPPGLLRVPSRDAKERVRDVVERIAAPLHETPQRIVAVGAGAVVGREHGTHIGVHHEPCEHPQYVIKIVGPPVAAAFGVGHRHHAVDPGGRRSRGALRHLARESVGARGGGQHHDEVPRAHAAPAGAAIAREGRPGLGPRHLHAGRERGVVQRHGLHGVREVGGGRQREVDGACRQCREYLLVADIRAGREVAGRDAEGEAPRGEARTLRDRRADEAVSFEDGMGQAERAPSVRHEGAGIEAASRDRDIVCRRRNAGHPVEFETIAHHVLLCSTRCVRQGCLHYRETANGGSLPASRTPNPPGPSGISARRTTP